MAEEFVCETCGKKLRSAAGKAGHVMLAHPPVKPAPAPGESPELVLAEVLSDVRDAYNRLESRLQEFGPQSMSLLARLSDIDDRLGNLQTSMLDRISDAEAAREKAESESEAVHQVLDKWENAETHHRLRALWDHTENCPDCAEDKAAIIAELTGKAPEELAVEAPEQPVVEAEESGATSDEAAVEPSAGEPAKVAVEAEVQTAEVVRFRVVKEPSVVDFLTGRYKELPADASEPKVGDETEDLTLAEAWKKAGCKVEEISAAPAPAPDTTKQVDEPETVVEFLTRERK